MKLENAFEVPAPPAVAWPILLDVPAIVPCVPGAELVEVTGPNAYKGRARVKVGPIALAFNGQAEITERDEATHTAKVAARGADGKGRGSAQANVAFRLVPAGAGTRVEISTDLSLTGAVAQYGRASGLIEGIAAEIVKDFARNLEALIREREAAAPAPPPSEVPADAAAAPMTAEPDAAPASPPASPGTATPPAPPRPIPVRTAPAAAVPVSGLSILWRVFKAMVGRWFGRKD